MTEWIVRGTEVPHRNPWFSVLKQTVERPDGSHATHYTISHDRPAVGIVVRDGDRYLLIRQHRFIVDQFVWAIPSGGVDASETLEQAAARELREETGLEARSLRHLLHFYPTYGCSNQRFELFLADGVSSTGDRFDTNEVIGQRWFSSDELKALIADNGIVDGLSLVPLLLVLHEQ